MCSHNMWGRKGGLLNILYNISEGNCSYLTKIYTSKKEIICIKIEITK